MDRWAHRVPLTSLFADSCLAAAVAALLSAWGAWGVERMVLEQPQFASLWSAGRTAIFADSRLGASVTALLCPWARGEAFTPDVDRMVLEHPQFASLIESCRGAPNVELRAHRVPLTLLFTHSGLGATSGRGVTPNVELPGAPCSIRAAARPVVNRSLRQSTNCFRAPRFGAAAVVRPMVERSLRQRVVLEHSLLDGDWGCSGRSGARITASRPTG